jgi:ABC-type nitrate/sulfonate/bicarbonate transport system permease component
MFAVIILLGGMGFVADRLFALMQQNILWRYQAGR